MHGFKFQTTVISKYTLILNSDNLLKGIVKYGVQISIFVVYYIKRSDKSRGLVVRVSDY